MALHDFRCPECGYIKRDVNVPIAVGAVDAVVLCPGTWHDEVRMIAIPGIGRMDASNGPAFKAFDTYDGRNQKVHVTSLKQVRAIERESEQLHRDGEGQPLVFRAFSNDPSNKDQSALHKNWTGGEQPTDAAKARFGGATQKSASEPETGYGPGVSDDNASALARD